MNAAPRLPPAAPISFYDLSLACLKLWRRRQQHRALIERVLTAVEPTMRLCLQCRKPMQKADPRTLTCSRLCGQRRRRRMKGAASYDAHSSEKHD